MLNMAPDKAADETTSFRCYPPVCLIIYRPTDRPALTVPLLSSCLSALSFLLDRSFLIAFYPSSFLLTFFFDLHTPNHLLLPSKTVLYRPFTGLAPRIDRGSIFLGLRSTVPSRSSTSNSSNRFRNRCTLYLVLIARGKPVPTCVNSNGSRLRYTASRLASLNSVISARAAR